LASRTVNIRVISAGERTTPFLFQITSAIQHAPGWIEVAILQSPVQLRWAAAEYRGSNNVAEDFSGWGQSQNSSESSGDSTGFPVPEDPDANQARIIFLYVAAATSAACFSS